MRRGLIDKLRNTKNVNFLTKLSTLFEFSSCFSISLVVYYSNVIIEKLPTNTTTVLIIVVVKLESSPILISYWNITP